MTKNSKKSRKRSKSKIILVLAALAVLGCVAVLDYYLTFYKPNSAKSEDVKIYRSYTYDEACRAIIDSGAVKDTVTFLRAARNMGLKDNFKSGLYRFKAGAGNKAIVRKISHGWQTPIELVVPGYARNLERFSEILSERLEADSASFMAAFTNDSIRIGCGFKPETFIGMFIPNTYEVYWTITPEQFIERMKKEYDAFWTQERRDKAKAIGLTREEVSTLASIVIEETKYEPEMDDIAGVYMNRLNKGMLLQADPTVKYALNDPSIKRILFKHLEVDSPYNTYKYAGLPPGPITIPTVAALDAVLNYTHHDYLYFCANATFDGRHAFAVTLAKHLENAAAYQRALTGKGNR